MGYFPDVSQEIVAPSLSLFCSCWIEPIVGRTWWGDSQSVGGSAKWTQKRKPPVKAKGTEARRRGVRGAAEGVMEREILSVRIARDSHGSVSSWRAPGPL
jgi:hypothetical protein